MKMMWIGAMLCAGCSLPVNVDPAANPKLATGPKAPATAPTAPPTAPTKAQPNKVEPQATSGVSGAYAVVLRFEETDAYMMVACREPGGAWKNGSEKCPDQFYVGVVRPPTPGLLQQVSWTATRTDHRKPDPCFNNELTGLPKLIGPTRTITTTPASSSKYTKLVSDALSLNAVTLDSILRVDLQGDGVEEVLFVGHFEAPPSKNQRDAIIAMGLDAPVKSTWSVAGIRRVIDDKVVTQEIYRSEGAPWVPTPSLTIEGFVDVEEDGVFEVVVSERLHEGYGVTLYDLRAKPSPIGSNGCGS